MFLFGNLFQALASVIDILLTILYWLIIVRALLSWVNPDPYNPIVQILYKTTEPMLSRIRKLIPLNYNVGLDISPIIAFLIIIFLKTFLVKTLLDLSLRFG